MRRGHQGAVLLSRRAQLRGPQALGIHILFVRSPPPLRPSLGPGLQGAGREATTGERPLVQIFVRDNNVDQALKALKKKMQREGIFREMKLRGHYEKPSEKKAREKAEAIRRARKLARKRMQREGLLPMKPKVVPGAGGPGRPPRPPRPPM